MGNNRLRYAARSKRAAVSEPEERTNRGKAENRVQGKGEKIMLSTQVIYIDSIPDKECPVCGRDHKAGDYVTVTEQGTYCSHAHAIEGDWEEVEEDNS